MDVLTGGRKGIGGHQSQKAGTTTWLTPPYVIDALGGWQSFDMDPCAAPSPRPWPTALYMNTQSDSDGLRIDWRGRVWLNPPYSSPGVGDWLQRMAEHDNGTALIFARTETDIFDRYVWQSAHGLLFLVGRLYFHLPDGSRAAGNAGAPSVLAAYGENDRDILAEAKLPGHFVRLK